MYDACKYFMYFSTSIELSIFSPGDLEHWDENDSDLDADFPSDVSPHQLLACEEPDANLTQDQHAVIWWVVAFSCIFQTLHSVSSRGVAWLLKFLGALLSFLGLYSNEIAGIALAFPSTLHQRTKYLKEKLSIASVCHYVVCPACLDLSKYEHCLEKYGNRVCIKTCSQCKKSRKHVPLLKAVITSSGCKKYYPFLVFPSACLISSLQSLLARPGFYASCEEWRNGFVLNCSSLSDIYGGRVWSEFLQFEGQPFLSAPNSIAFMLNIDWFQPYKHRVYSIGVIYLAIMNLPRAIRFKRENIILVGLIPGPSEPSLTMNTYLTPLVADLLALWDGISFSTSNNGTQVIRCALLCIGCDLPAGRKACGFLSHSANLGCSKCYSNFGTGIFGKQNYSGFDRSKWALRTNEEHRSDIEVTLTCSSKTERQRKESELGCRYSSLLQLPYFDVVRMLIIDPMHNLYLGTAKHMLCKIWVRADIVDSKTLELINERILLLVIPPEIRFSRLPAHMEHASSLTAEQWMLWVNYYSIYCLHELIPSQHLECWRVFVLASRLLCKSRLTSDDIKLADAALLRFCREFQSLYGQDSVTPNVHLHAHLMDCIRDYGPMSSFWLFSFERFNGILGNENTNNRSIEVQLMDRFLKDNAHLHLLSCAPSASSDVTSTFTHAVLDHAYGFVSTKHLDATSCDPPPDQVERFLPAPKYTICSFSDLELNILRKIYSKVFPSNEADSYFLRSFRKMPFMTVDGQKIKSGLYMMVKNVFEFSSASSSFMDSSFSARDTRPAKVDYLFMHSRQVNGNTISTMFAAVSWPMRHPLQYLIGKPYELWCVSAFETCNSNYFVPMCNFLTLLLTAEQIIHDKCVLVTIPVIL